MLNFDHFNHFKCLMLMSSLIIVNVNQIVNVNHLVNVNQISTPFPLGPWLATPMRDQLLKLSASMHQCTSVHQCT